jgi:proteasome assembly chaperone (PAC2) family protein
MGSVALGAGSFLVDRLKAVTLHEVEVNDYFDIDKVEILNGCVRSARTPRSTFYAWRNPSGGPDLVIFVGEAQPSNRGYEFCHKLMDRAVGFGVERVFTFAAMATPIHPAAAPRVFGVVSDVRDLADLQKLKRVSVLKEGEISGLNGILLAVAGERGLPGTCLLGELPFFAIGVPNPKASRAVLQVFQEISDIRFDMAELDDNIRSIERGLIELLDRMNRAAAQARLSESEADEDGEGNFSVPSFVTDSDAKSNDSEDSADSEGGSVDPRTQRRISRLFERAQKDRTKALELKHELDRLGLFKEYEDRFLDLFRSGE